MKNEDDDSSLKIEEKMNDEFESWVNQLMKRIDQQLAKPHYRYELSNVNEKGT